MNDQSNSKPFVSLERHDNLYNPDAEVVTRNVLACLKNGGAACDE